MKTFYRILMGVVFFLVIILGGIRFCLTSFFIDLEYRTPGFPEDQFGFTAHDRTQLAYQSVDYLLGNISDQDYQNLSFPDGRPIFNQRELSHMRDVRDLTVITMRIWYISLVALLLGIVLAFLLGWQRDLMKAGKTSATVILLFIFGVLLAVILNFNQLFTSFHSIFFEGDTWLFYTSDSLIRLFPTPFWVNVFVAIGVIAFTLALILYFSCGWLLRKNKKEV